MKNFAKRGFSILLALCLCLSLLSGIALPEASAASYVYNWGTRGTVADEDDFTRSTAEEWYKAEGTSYEELSQLSGSATSSSVPTSALFKELRSLMRGAVTDTTSYNDIKTLCKYTDCQNGGGKISSFYSGAAIGPSWDGSWNREHVWPNSKGDANGSGENDIFMLRPTTTAENSDRGNDAYGESGSYYNPNKESGGKYDLRGDVVRIIMFVYVRWQSISSGSTGVLYGSSGVIENRDIMLKWMEEDPVDTWELGRNDACQSITGTRNVFVDYPELGFQLFGAEVPDNYQSPSGAGNAVSYSITATSNNTSYGTVSVSGKTITATPKTGYYISGYKVTSGSATVTQSGNTFKVTASSDCSICINFAAKTAVTLTFMENGVTAKTIASYGGDSVTLPSNTNTPAEGYSFLGWTDGLVNDTTTKPTIYNAGASVSASNKTYYAVYSYSVGGTGVTEWSLKNLSEIKTGDVFVITMTTSSGTVYALPNGTIDKGPAAQTVAVSNGKLTSTPASNLLWNLGGSSNAWEFYPDGQTAQWLNCKNDNNGVSVGTGSDKTFKLNSGYLYNNGTSRYVGVYTNNPDWRCYTSSSTNIGGQTLGFYVKSESGTTYYTTSTFVCEHEDSGATSAVAATCTTTGYTAGVFCNDCEQYLSGHEVVPALGHSWGAWVQTTAPTCTAAGTETSTCIRCSETKTQSVAAKGHSYTSVVTKPTETQQGYTTYTCTTCGHSYKDNYTEATGQTLYVSFCVPKDVASVATMACGKDGITLPSAAAPAGYTFLGWTTEAVEDTETQPTILTGSYNATKNVTLYAVYSYTEGGSGVTSYQLVTDANQLKSGAKLVIASNEKGVVAGGITSQYMSKITASFSSDNTTLNSLPSGVVVLTLGGSTGAWTLSNESGKLLGATTVKKLAWGSGTTTWSISVESDGGAIIQNGTSTYGAFRYNSSSPRFTTYTSAVSDSMLLPQLYMEVVSGTTYYTTLTTLDPVAAVDGVEYASFEAAYAACGEGQIIELLTTIGEGDPISITLDKDLYIDLSGCELYADVTANGYSVYGKDSVTDTYASDDFGSLTLTGDVTVNGQDGYAAYDWGQNEWSFHAYEVKLVAVSLKPGSDALGYKAQFFGDEIVSDMVTGFGFNLWVNPDNVITQSYESATNEQIISLRLQGIMAANGGEIPIYANAFVTFSNEDPWTTDTYSTTLRSAMEAVSANIQNYDTQQIIALQTYIESHAAKMTAWDIDPIKQWSAI